MANTEFSILIDYANDVMTMTIDEGGQTSKPVRIDGCELFCRADPAGFRVQVGREIVKPPTETAEDARKITHSDLGSGRYL